MSETTEEPAMLPAAVSRALRQAAAHPSVRSVTVTGQVEDWTLAKITIHTELPALWRAAGESPFGVRVDEEVTIGLRKDFPLSAPWIALRKDFPRFHPHIQPDKPDTAVRPCLVNGSPREVIQARGFIGLVEQLVEWLDRAANLDLNDPEHGWEPVRRDTIDDIVACDGDRLRASVTPAGGFEYRFTNYFHYLGADTYKLLLGTEPVAIEPYPTSLINRDNEDDPGGAGVALSAWAGPQNGVPFVAGFYLPETVENVGELLDRAGFYGCRTEVEAGLISLRDALIANPTLHRFPLLVILLARRPYALVGSTSNIEICPYLIDVEPEQDFLDAATPVRLVAQRETINSALLRRTSRDVVDIATRPWTLIGCGSVGSKIALHAARTGRAPSILVDRSYLDAHNYARHAAIPYGAADRLFLRAKVDAVKEQITKLGQSATRVAKDAVGLIIDAAERGTLAGPETAMIVDTTASLVTREALAHADWPARPRVVEACLLGAGRLGYLAREGAGANPSISDLAAEAYRRLAEDPEAAKVAFGAEAEEVSIGQGCSAATFPMPDSELSLLSAAMAQPIAKWARDGLPEGGEVRIGRTDAHGGLQWFITEELPWIDVGSGADMPKVRLHPRVHAAIEADVALYPGVETGGVLVGRFSQIGNLFQIVDLIPAPPDSTRSAHEFNLGTQGLKTAAAKVARDTGGALQVVGTWHSHLAPSGPSHTDAIAGAVLAFRQYVPALLLIHTPAGYSMLVAETLFVANEVAAEIQAEEA